MSEPTNLAELIAAVAALQTANANVVDAAQEILDGAPLSTVPHALGVLGASATLPITEYKAIEASVGSVSATTITLPTLVPGARSFVVLTATDDCTVTLPAVDWVEPINAVWSGVMTTGQKVIVSFVGLTTGWLATQAEFSQSAIIRAILASSIAFNDTNTNVAAGSDVDAAITTLDAAVYRLRAPDDVQTVAGAITGLSFAGTRRIYVELLADSPTVTLTAPPHTETCSLITKQDATGGHSIVFTNTIKWANSEAPTPAEIAGTEVLYTFEFANGSIYGSWTEHGVPA